MKQKRQQNVQFYLVIVLPDRKTFHGFLVASWNLEKSIRGCVSSVDPDPSPSAQFSRGLALQIYSIV